jgi:spermidine/putrescine transport system ATP-binding protein
MASRDDAAESCIGALQATSVDSVKMSEDYAVEIREVVKDYGLVRAVDSVSLQVRRGEFLCVIGPSGCGKTTLLRMVAGFIQPTSGDILVHGKSMLAVPPYRRPVNMVFQHYALFPHMTVAENIAFGLEMRKVNREDRRRQVAEILALVELSGFESRPVDQLSGGQEQRVALARALVLKPTTLLLDEPLGALDQKVRRKMQLELKRIHRDIGITFIHVTHDQEEALAMADRIAIMNNSKLEQVGDIYDVYLNPKTPFVAEFVGESNIIEGEVHDRPNIGRAIALTADQWAGLPSNCQVGPGRNVKMFLRPERLTLWPEPGASMNLFNGTVLDVIFLGEALRAVVRIADGIDLMASIPAAEAGGRGRPAHGDRVTVGWPRDAALVFPLDRNS